MKVLQNFLGYLDTSEAWAYILDQHPGYGIIVAPGWLHCVFNVQYCVKYAVEFVKAMNVPAYVQACREATYLHGDVNGEGVVTWRRLH